MTDRDTFVRQICEHPDDDTTRLVFADFLEEHGERQYAEFVRHEVARPEKDWRCGVDGLGVTGALMFGTRTIRPPVGAPPGTCYVVRRGFVARVEATCEWFLKNAEAVFAEHPVTEVGLIGHSPLKTTDGWIWYRHGAGAEADIAVHRDTLPETIFDLLPVAPIGRAAPADECRGWPILPANALLYLTPGRALTAVSRVCVGIGRHRAGLPPLRTEQAVPV